VTSSQRTEHRHLKKINDQLRNWQIILAMYTIILHTVTVSHKKSTCIHT